MESRDSKEIIEFDNAGLWEAWLADHYDKPDGIWVRIAKKDSGKKSITLQEALDVALCYAWIDSIRKSYHETSFLQKYSPRRPTGSWSKINVQKVEALVAAGRMRPPGPREAMEAKADGRWDAAYDSQNAASIPPDLAAALKQNRRAKSSFDQLTKSGQYAVILPVLKATTSQI